MVAIMLWGICCWFFKNTYSLCQRTQQHPHIWRENLALYQRNATTFIQNVHGKFEEKRAYEQAMACRKLSIYNRILYTL